MEVSNLIRVEYHGEAVLSTKQIADAYECSPGNIRWNFAKNADKFVEGVHYFKLEGAALREFKEYVSKIWAQFSRADGMENFQSAEINEAGKSRSLEFPFGKTASAVIIWTCKRRGRFSACLKTVILGKKLTCRKLKRRLKWMKTLKICLNRRFLIYLMKLKF